jgi:HEAT repeat protein
MLDQAFDALKKLDWGADLGALNPIGEAIVATQADAAARKELETRLAAVLKSEAPRDAKDFVCRKLMQIGTAASVPALAGLLADKDLAHMARFALERMDAPEASQALREALPKLEGALKVGAISSLGVRRDAQSVPALAGLLADADPQVARAAALALGTIRSPEAAKALAEAKPSDAAKLAATDSRLACAEVLLAEGKKQEALAIYKTLVGEDQPKQVRLAAVRGTLACAGKKE